MGTTPVWLPTSWESQMPAYTFTVSIEEGEGRSRSLSQRRTRLCCKHAGSLVRKTLLVNLAKPLAEN